MKIIYLDTIDSTNSYLERTVHDQESPTMVMARHQTSGRGQRGNSWESAAGKNLTFSVMFRPAGFKANRQFAISEAVALAVVDFLKLHGITAKVKWPNDIYVGDKKICGILIKHSLIGSNIAYSILGIGINVNQDRFLSDAPNPVSMLNITRQYYDLNVLSEEVASCVEKSLMHIYEPHRAGLHDNFMRSLWRGDGSFKSYMDTASGETFDGKIEDIDEEGVLTLALRNGGRRQYRFKEVSALL